MADNWSIIDIPARHKDYAQPVARTVEVGSLEAAKEFATRNGGKLFWIRSGVVAFVNLSDRTPEEIVM